MVMVVFVITVMMAFALMVFRTTEQHGTHDVHDEPDDGDGDRLLKMDRLRLEEALQGCPRHQNGNAEEKNRAGEAAEDFDFPGTEGVAAVLGVTPCRCVGEGAEAD